MLATTIVIPGVVLPIAGLLAVAAGLGLLSRFSKRRKATEKQDQKLKLQLEKQQLEEEQQREARTARRKIESELGDWWDHLYDALTQVKGNRIRYEIVRRFVDRPVPTPDSIFREKFEIRDGVPKLTLAGASHILSLIYDEGQDTYRSWVESLLARHLLLNIPATKGL